MNPVKVAVNVYGVIGKRVAEAARQTVKNVEKAGWKINVVQDLAAGGIFKKIKAVKTA